MLTRSIRVCLRPRLTSSLQTTLFGTSTTSCARQMQGAAERPGLRHRSPSKPGFVCDANTQEQLSTQGPESKDDSGTNAAGKTRLVSEMLLAKVYYGITSGAGVFLYPYLSLYLRQLGASDGQIGILCALRPWLSMAATMAGPMIADKWQCHRAMLVLTFGISTLLRASMYMVGQMHIVMVLLLLADFVAGPVGPMADSMVLSACKNEADYGRQRLWGSVGWGALAPLAGMLVQAQGLGAGFLSYSLLSIPAMVVVANLGKKPKQAPTSTSDIAKSPVAAPVIPVPDDEPPSGGPHHGVVLVKSFDDEESLGRVSSRHASNAGAINDSHDKYFDQARAGTRRSPQLDRSPSPNKSRAHRDQMSSPGGVHTEKGRPMRNAFASSGGRPGTVTVNAYQEFKDTDDLYVHERDTVNLDQHFRSPSPRKDVMQEISLGSPNMATTTSGGIHRRSGTSMRPTPAASEAGIRASQGGATSLDAHLDMPSEQAPLLEEDAHKSASFWQNVKLLLSRVEVWQLLLQSLAGGFGAGIVGTYLFLYAQDLGAGTTLMGMLLMFDCMAETPVFYFQGKIQERMSPTAMLHLALGAMVLRLLLYASVPMLPGQSPWAMLPIELLQGLTLAAAWSALCVLSKRLAPPGLQATLQGLSTAAFGGLGGGLGGLLGGILLEQHLGWPAMWTASAGVVALLWGISTAAPILVRNRKPARAVNKGSSLNN